MRKRNGQEKYRYYGSFHYPDYISDITRFTMLAGFSLPNHRDFEHLLASQICIIFKSLIKTDEICHN